MKARKSDKGIPGNSSWGGVPRSFLLVSGMTLAGSQAGHISLNISKAMEQVRDLSPQQDFRVTLVGM